MSQQAMPWGAKNGDRRPDWETPTVLFREIERRYAHGGRFDVEVITVPTIGDGSRADVRRIASGGGDLQSLGSALINQSVEAMMRGLAPNQGEDE